MNLMTKLLFFFILPILLWGQAKYYVPIPITSSAGRPIKNATVIIYPTGTTSGGITMTWEDAGSYYYTGGASTVANGAYDIYVSGLLYRTNVYFGNNDASALTANWQSDIGDSIRQYQILSSWTETQIQAEFDNIAASGDSLVIVEFEQEKEYNFTSKIKLQGAKDLRIFTNGAKFNGDGLNCVLQIVNDTAAYDTNYRTTLDASYINGNISKGATTIITTADTLFNTLEKGDLLAISDSTSYRSSGTYYYNSIQVLVDNYNSTTNTITLLHPTKSSITQADIHCINIIKLKNAVYIDEINGENFSVDIGGYNSVYVGNANLITTLSEANQHYHALRIVGTNSFYINNLHVEGWLKNGYGYGLSCDLFSYGAIGYAYGFDCRHVITTNATYKNQNGTIEVFGGVSTFSEDYKNTYPCWDTHGQLEKIILHGVQSYNGSHGLQVRANSAELYNTHSENLSGSVTAIVHTGEIEKKPYVLIDGGQAINCKCLYTTYDSVQISRIEVNNFVWDAKDKAMDADVYVMSNDDAAMVDTVIIKNSKFYGSKNNTTSDETYLMIFYKSTISGVTKTVKKCIIDNNFTTDMSLFHIRNSIAFDDLEVTNNKFNKGRYFVYSIGVDDSSITTKNYQFTNNKFHTFNTGFDYSDELIKIQNFNFNNNELWYVGRTTTYSNIVYESPVINHNKFYDTPYGGGYVFRSQFLRGVLDFSGNKFYPRNENALDEIYNAYSTQGYSYGSKAISVGLLYMTNEDGFNPTIRYHDNYYNYIYGSSGSTSAWVQTDSANGSFVNNYFAPDTIGDDVIFDIRNYSNLTFEKNIIESNFNGNCNLFRVRSSSTVKFNLNTYRALSGAYTLRPYYLESGTNSYMGINMYENMTNSGSISSNKYYIPIMFHYEEIDSVQVTGDSLFFYQGSTKLKFR